jgi:hypothetical protein
MDSWWRLGESSGYDGDKLALHQITCPFCEERGNIERVAHFAKQHAQTGKALNFDTYQCGNCANYVLLFWSASRHSFRGMHDYKMVPWPRRLTEYPKHWPDEVGRSWIEAHRSLMGENWGAAAVMARSSLQAALRDQGAKGSSLYDEINDLATKGLLPPLMKDWSHEVRVLGRPAAHPNAVEPATDPKDARDVVEFLDYLTEYLYDLPRRIEDYRARKP